MHSFLLSLSLLVSPISFSHLDVENGLSQTSVFSISQDDKGYMWFGTYDGLCRFDGNEVDVFRNDPADDGSISGNIIRSLLFDSKGRLWAATNKGFSMFEKESESFLNIDMGIDNLNIVGMTELDDTHIVACRSSQIYVIDTETMSLETDPSAFGFNGNDCFAYNSPFGLIVASNDGSISRFEREGRRTFPVERIHRILSMTSTPDSCLFIASEGQGFFKLDIRTGQARRYPISSKHVRSLCLDNNGNIWVGTANNLNIFSPSDESIVEIAPDTNNPEGLSNASIRSLFCDNSGGIWAGTFFGGVNYYNPWRSRFESIRYSSSDKDVVGFITADEDDNLWVGTFRDGVLKYDSNLSYRKIDALKSGEKDESKDIKCIVFNGQDVYVGSELGGLRIYNRSTGEMRQIDSKGRFGSVYCMCRTQSGNYLMGTNSGMYLYKPLSDTISAIPGFGLVRTMHKNSAPGIWVGGDGFLSRCVETLNPDGNETLLNIRQFEEISWVQDINTIGEYTWIGTRNGLFRYSISRDIIEKIDFSGKSISAKAIEDGGNGKIWISSEQGIYCYDVTSGKSRHYGRNDGLVSTTYNIGSRVKLSDGSICFGGLNGITRFNPSEINPPSFTPDPMISKVSVDGKQIKADKNNTVHLRAGRSIVSFRFSSPDFISWRKTSYQYCLTGFEKTWRDSDITRTATYSNLPKGHYEFKVYSSNPDGVRSQSPATLFVRVHPAWYQTTLFIIFLIILLSSSLTYFVVDHIRDIRKTTSEQIEGLKLRLYSGQQTDSQLSKQDAQFLKKVLSIVNDNLANEHFSTELLAKEIGMSRTGLHTKLKTITGESTLEFIKKVRFDEACELLRTGGLTVAEVGYKVGYSSPAYFTTSFKKRIGKTPKEYQDLTFNRHRPNKNP